MESKAKIIDGKAVAQRIKEDIAKEIAAIKEAVPKAGTGSAKPPVPAHSARVPGLAVIIAGSDPASRIYVNSKKKTCESLGIYFEEHAFADDVTEADLLDSLEELNRKEAIDAILVQLPLPSHIDEKKVIFAIDPSKDADGLHPVSLGKLVAGDPGFTPCTPTGVMELIKETGETVAGKMCVVVGRSILVGKPQALLLLAGNGTVTICHSKTRNLEEICRSADILVAAVGKTGLIKADMVKPGAIVIDVGMNRLDNGKLCGDVDFEPVAAKAGYITPVPGGVGPMTIAMLMQNTLKAYNLHMAQLGKT